MGYRRSRADARVVAGGFEERASVAVLVVEAQDRTIALLGHDSIRVRCDSVRTLAAWANEPGIRKERAARAAVRTLGDEAPEVRVQAARTLQSLGESDSVPHLIETLEDDDLSVRRASRSALAYLVGKDLGGSQLNWKTYLENEHESP